MNKIYKDYQLPLDLYIKLKKSMFYENKKDIHDLSKFIDELPHKLKTEVSLHVYESRYENIKFFKNKKNISFILWMCQHMKPLIYTENQFFFQENELINEVFFLIKGRASFVLPRYKNTPYINIAKGNHFGIIDIVGSAHTQNIDMKDWFSNRNKLLRQFSVISKDNSEALYLGMQHLYQMEMEFLNCFQDLFDSAFRRLRNAWVIKLDAIRQCNKINNDW